MICAVACAAVAALLWLLPGVGAVVGSVFWCRFGIRQHSPVAAAQDCVSAVLFVLPCPSCFEVKRQHCSNWHLMVCCCCCCCWVPACWGVPGPAALVRCASAAGPRMARNHLDFAVHSCGRGGLLWWPEWPYLSRGVRFLPPSGPTVRQGAPVLLSGSLADKLPETNGDKLPRQMPPTFYRVDDVTSTPRAGDSLLTEQWTQMRDGPTHCHTRSHHRAILLDTQATAATYIAYVNGPGAASQDLPRGSTWNSAPMGRKNKSKNQQLQQQLLQQQLLQQQLLQQQLLQNQQAKQHGRTAQALRPILPMQANGGLRHGGPIHHKQPPALEQKKRQLEKQQRQQQGSPSKKPRLDDPQPTVAPGQQPAQGSQLPAGPSNQPPPAEQEPTAYLPKGTPGRREGSRSNISTSSDISNSRKVPHRAAKKQAATPQQFDEALMRQQYQSLGLRADAVSMDRGGRRCTAGRGFGGRDHPTLRKTPACSLPALTGAPQPCAPEPVDQQRHS